MPPSKKWKKKHGAYMNVQRDRYTKIYNAEPLRHPYHPDERHFTNTLKDIEELQVLMDKVYVEEFIDRYMVSLRKVVMHKISLSETRKIHDSIVAQGVDGHYSLPGDSDGLFLDIFIDGAQGFGVEYELEDGAWYEITWDNSLTIGAYATESYKYIAQDLSATDITQFDSSGYAESVYSGYTDDEGNPVPEIGGFYGETTTYNSSGEITGTVDWTTPYSDDLSPDYYQDIYKKATKTVKRLQPINKATYSWDSSASIDATDSDGMFKNQWSEQLGEDQETSTQDYTKALSVVDGGTDEAKVVEVNTELTERPAIFTGLWNINGVLPDGTRVNDTTTTTTDYSNSSIGTTSILDGETDANDVRTLASKSNVHNLGYKGSEDKYGGVYPIYPLDMAKEGLDLTVKMDRALLRETARKDNGAGLARYGGFFALNGKSPSEFTALSFSQLEGTKEQAEKVLETKEEEIDKLVVLLEKSYQGARRMNLSKKKELIEFSLSGAIPTFKVNGKKIDVPKVIAHSEDTKVDAIRAGDDLPLLVSADDLEGQLGLTIKMKTSLSFSRIHNSDRFYPEVYNFKGEPHDDRFNFAFPEIEIPEKPRYEWPPNEDYPTSD